MIDMSSSSEYPDDTADALISFAMEKETEKARSLPSALSASAEDAVIGVSIQETVQLDQQASRGHARRLFCNSVPFGVVLGDSGTEVLLDMCASFVIYRDWRENGDVSKKATSRKTLKYDGVVYGTNIHNLLHVARCIVYKISHLRVANWPSLAQSLMDTLLLYEQARGVSRPLSIRAIGVPRMWGRKCKRKTQHRIFHSMEMVGASVILPLLCMLMMPHVPCNGDTMHRKWFVLELYRLLEFCKARRMTSDPDSDEWQAIDNEVTAIERGMQALSDAAQNNAFEHSDAADSCTTLQLRVAEYMRGAWPPDDRSNRLVSFGSKRSHATLWDIRGVPTEKHKYSSVASSSVSGSSLSQDSTDFADAPGVSVRRLNTPPRTPPNISCEDSLLVAFESLP